MSTQAQNGEWNLYRTRFLVKAMQLTEPFSFENALGYTFTGRPGDYLVEWSHGVKRILSQQYFEDVYVALGAAEENLPSALPPKLPVKSVAPDFPDRRAAAG